MKGFLYKIKEMIVQSKCMKRARDIAVNNKFIELLNEVYSEAVERL